MRFASLDIKTDYLSVCRVRRILILLSVLIRKLWIEEKSEFSSLKGKIKELVFYKLEIDKKKKNNKDLENFLRIKGKNMQVLHFISLNLFNIILRRSIKKIGIFFSSLGKCVYANSINIDLSVSVCECILYPRLIYMLLLTSMVIRFCLMVNKISKEFISQ